MATTFDARGFMQDFTQAMSTKDPERLLRHYADGVELTDPTTRQPLKGKEGVRQNVRQWSTAMSEMSFDLKDAITAPGKVALLFEARGRHTGELELGPGERLPATNKPVRMDVANFLTLDDTGMIVKDQAIFDLASMMTQLGLMPDAQAGDAATQRTRAAGAQPRGR